MRPPSALHQISCTTGHGAGSTPAPPDTPPDLPHHHRAIHGAGSNTRSPRFPGHGAGSWAAMLMPSTGSLGGRASEEGRLPQEEVPAAYPRRHYPPPTVPGWMPPRGQACAWLRQSGFLGINTVCIHPCALSVVHYGLCFPSSRLMHAMAPAPSSSSSSPAFPRRAAARVPLLRPRPRARHSRRPLATPATTKNTATSSPPLSACRQERHHHTSS
ncbi:hypothetical protein VPH35_116829 [Triticum aestivum]